MRPEILTITPELATDWLENNARNRHLSDALVKSYAEAMRRGEWVENSAAIAFDHQGHLLDGQHRLWAVVLSGIPLRSLVLWDVEPGAQDTIDIGKKRQLADVLAIRGESQATTLAAALVQLWRLEVGKSMSGAPTPAQTLALLQKHPGIRSSIPVAQRVYRHAWLRPGVGAALHYHFSQLEDGKNDADDFFEKLYKGANLAEDSSLLLLRQLLEREKARELKLSQGHSCALVIKAWNAYRDNEPMRVLRWSPGGNRPEKFPKAH